MTCVYSEKNQLKETKDKMYNIMRTSMSLWRGWWDCDGINVSLWLTRNIKATFIGHNSYFLLHKAHHYIIQVRSGAYISLHLLTVNLQPVTTCHREGPPRPATKHHPIVAKMPPSKHHGGEDWFLQKLTAGPNFIKT